MNFNEYWLKKESTHYIFNYKKDSFAELHIDEIISEQEQCFLMITSLLKTFPDKKINYWLCDTRKQVSELSGYDETNGLTNFRDGVATIYCVYNEAIQCIGFHEDTHAIAFYYSDVKCDALAEGLAMYMDKKWWQLDNELCTKVYLETGNYIPLEEMIYGNFYEIQDKISYPIMGAFVKRLIESYGIEKFKEIYVYEDDNWPDAFYNIFKVTFADVEKEFIDYIHSLNYTECQMEKAYITLFEN